MGRVDDWFDGFVTRHIVRISRDDWPEPDSPYWAGFRAVLIRHGVTEEIAEAASVAMMETEAPRLNQHLQVFLSHVRAAWKAHKAEAEAPTSREAAERQSRDCPDCDGAGLAFRPDMDLGDGRRLRNGTMYCICPLGRWIEQNHRTNSPDVRRRMLDLKDFPALQSGDDVDFGTAPLF